MRFSYKITTSIAAAITAILLSVNAFADQAAYISHEEADRAFALLQDKKVYVSFCELCSDTTAIKINIQTIEAKPVGYQDYYGIYINNENVDLAYTYYKDGTVWRNAALHANIEVFDVSPTISDDF